MAAKVTDVGNDGDDDGFVVGVTEGLIVGLEVGDFEKSLDEVVMRQLADDDDTPDVVPHVDVPVVHPLPVHTDL